MRPPTFLAVSLLPGIMGTLAAGASGQVQEAEPVLETRVWLDRGEEPVLQRGDQVRVYYRTSEDAWAAIFRIDTDGAISMVFPQHPGAIEPVRGGRDYRLLFPEAPAWRVLEDPGVGYFFMVASPEPLDFSAFPFDPERGWDLGAVSGVVYEDPYVAIDDYVALLVPDWEVVPYALDFLTYHVGSTYSYPRFLCYDCHTPRAYAAWNPYSVVCSSFRVVIWDDPYFYPSYRYAGTSVVVTRPPRALPRYEVVTRAPGDIGVRPLVRSRAAPARRVAEFKEAPTVDPATRVPVRRAAPAPAAQQARPGATSRAPQEDPRGAPGRPTLQRRPSGRLPARTPPSAAAPRRPQARGAPSAGRQEPAGPGGRVQPDLRRPNQERTGSPSGTEPARRAPTRPSASPDARPPSPTRPGRGRPAQPTGPSARPTAPSRGTARATSPAPSRPTPRATSPAPSRPSARPSPRPGPPSSRPAARPSSRPSARPAPAPREPAPRPTVRPRGRTRGN